MLWDTLLALSLIGILKYGDYIENCPQGNYACPTRCDVDHNHYPRKGCVDAKGKRNVWKGTWKTSAEKEKQQEKIEEYKDGKTEQESKSDTTIVQPVKQLYKKAVGADKSEGL